MMYVYIKSEPGLWTVGFYDPAGNWQPESDHATADKAAERVHWLNGGDTALTQNFEDVEIEVNSPEIVLRKKRAKTLTV